MRVFSFGRDEKIFLSALLLVAFIGQRRSIFCYAEKTEQWRMLSGESGAVWW
jgi:hypothetical protein